MFYRKQTNKMFVAIFTVAVLLFQPQLIPGVATQKTAAASSQVPSIDIGWPRQVQDASGTLVYYQPQIGAWKDYKQLVGKIVQSASQNRASNQSLGCTRQTVTQHNIDVHPDVVNGLNQSSLARQRGGGGGFRR